jgi:hypothetical protein
MSADNKIIDDFITEKIRRNKKFVKDGLDGAIRSIIDSIADETGEGTQIEGDWKLLDISLGTVEENSQLINATLEYNNFKGKKKYILNLNIVEA